VCGAVGQSIAFAIDADVRAGNGIARVAAHNAPFDGAGAGKWLAIDRNVLHDNLAGAVQLVSRIRNVAGGVLGTEGQRTDGKIADRVSAERVGRSCAELIEHRAADDHLRAGDRRAVVITHDALRGTAPEKYDADLME